MVRYGMAGEAGHGKARHGPVWQGMAGKVWQVPVGLGAARHGYFLKIEEYKQEEIINGF